MPSVFYNRFGILLFLGFYPFPSSLYLPSIYFLGEEVWALGCTGSVYLPLEIMLLPYEEDVTEGEEGWVASCPSDDTDKCCLKFFSGDASCSSISFLV